MRARMTALKTRREMKVYIYIYIGVQRSKVQFVRPRTILPYVVDMVNELHDGRSGFQIPVEAWDCISPSRCPHWLWRHVQTPVQYMPGVFFRPEVKRAMPQFQHLCPCTNLGQELVNLYLHSSYMLSWRGQGQAFFSYNEYIAAMISLSSNYLFKSFFFPVGGKLNCCNRLRL